MGFRSSSPRGEPARPAAGWSSLSPFVIAVLFLGLAGPASAPAALPGEPPADDPAAWLFSPDAVAEIDFTLPQESIDALNADPTSIKTRPSRLRLPATNTGPSTSAYA